MPSITAVELGADTCALVRTSVRRGTVHVSAVEMLDPGAFPGMDSFTTAVRQARRALKLPRRCRAVVWGLPEGSHRKDDAVKLLLAPLIAAGFNVNRVVSPCNALAALARLKRARGDGATCWLAINRGGVAILVVRPGKQLYSHSFSWDSSIGASGSQARLLQRYSLVAFLAPQVKRAMAEARKHGLTVEAVVTCGNLPDLRSLTMPLIEELDVEVETLDSLEGLVVTPAAAERLAEVASGIRLACAGLLARGTRAWDENRRRSVRRTGALLRAAAVVAGVLVIGYAWYARLNAPAMLSSFTRSAETTPEPPRVASAPPVVATSTPPVVSAQPVMPKPNPPVASAPPVLPKSNPRAPAPSVPAPAVSDAAKKPESNPKSPELRGAVSDAAKKPEANAPPRPVAIAPPVVAKSTPPVVSAPPVVPKPNPVVSAPPVMPKPNPPVASAPPKPSPPAVSVPASVVSDSAQKPNPAPPRTPLQPLVTVPAPSIARPAAPAASPPPSNVEPRPTIPTRAENRIPATPAALPPRKDVPPPAPTSGLNTPAVPADKPEAASNAPLPALLKDPLPRVVTILVSSDRRLATIESGQIIGIGDVLGRRIVVAIDERTVVLREPSGVQIRVGLGGRVVGVGRSDR